MWTLGNYNKAKSLCQVEKWPQASFFGCFTVSCKGGAFLHPLEKIMHPHLNTKG